MFLVTSLLIRQPKKYDLLTDKKQRCCLLQNNQTGPGGSPVLLFRGNGGLCPWGKATGA
jgi:hypothetical protein